MNKYQKGNRSCFAGALVCILISTVFAVALQFLKGDVLDNAAAGNVDSAIKYALFLFFFILCEILFYFFYKRLNAKFVVGCTRFLKLDIFESILQLSYVEYRSRQQGEYISKYTTEADTISSRRFAMLPMLFEIVFKIILVSAALFLLDWRIAIITIVLLTTPLYVPKLIEKRLQRAQSEHLEAVKETISELNDRLSGFEIIKNYSIERKVMEKFRLANDNSMKKLLADMQLGSVAQLITTLISYLSYFIVLAFAAWLVLAGKFTPGYFFIAIGMIDQLSYPLISLAGIIRQLVAIRPACASMEEFLNTSPETQPEGGLKKMDTDISFHNVTFAYDGQEPILRNFNLTIEKGKRYLLKGASGCGKTTAVNLLLRYYTVGDGSIEIDGTPIERVGSPYGCMTVVRQEAILFHDTLRNNLTMYRNTPDFRLIEMLSRLGLEKFANADALDSMIAENGANLSGGEKKRICLARALLRDTDILILDEPLANLDNETANVIENLLLSITDKTMLLVSHQFSEEKLHAFDRVVSFSGLA